MIEIDRQWMTVRTGSRILGRDARRPPRPVSTTAGFDAHFAKDPKTHCGDGFEISGMRLARDFVNRVEGLRSNWRGVTGMPSMIMRSVGSTK